MRLRPRTWFVLSLLLFAASAYFWHLGEKRRLAAKSPAPASTSAPRTDAFSLTNPAVALAGTASSNAAAAPIPSTASVHSKTNPFAYRISNTPKSIGELVHDDHALLLRNAFYDTRIGERPEIPPHLRAFGNPGSYIVQARGAITDTFRRRVLESGAELVSYIPNNAMLVVATEQQMRKINNSPQVQAVLPFEPYYKLDNALLPVAVEKQLSPFGQLNVVAFPHQTEQAIAEIEKIGGVVLAKPERTPFGDNLVVKAPADTLAMLAQVRQVQIIGVHTQKRLMNDLTRVRVKISPNATNPPPLGQFGAPTTNDHLTGVGVLLSVNDSGGDSTHPDLIGRIFGTTNDLDGHGTHVLGTILGSGSQSATVPTVTGTTTNGSTTTTNTGSAAQGSPKGAWFSGMAPSATAFVQDYRAYSDIDLQQNAALTNAVISNNSWGYDQSDYDIFAASYDSAVRDSLAGVTGEQPITFVFAAGNSGGANAAGLGGAADSILSPATAKNVITVGSTELLRRITNEVSRNCQSVTNTNGVTIVCDTNKPWLPRTDSYDQIAEFSSRGNVGIGREGPHGRFKPDVVAPGEMLVSCRSADYVDPDNAPQTFVNTYNFVPLPPLSTNLYTVDIPDNCVGVTITVYPNSLSPTNFPPVGINAAMDTIPSGPPLTTNRSLTLSATSGPVLLTPPGTLFYTFANTTSNTLNMDFSVAVTITNDVGNFYQVLSNLNATVGPYYRYESGTRMSAAVVSGFLALMQEYFRVNLGVTNSPALNKALLINGARSLGAQYNFQVQAPINHQGWGLVNISNTIPGNLADPAVHSLVFYDQNSTNALVTGDAHVYTVRVPPAAQLSPLRVTLVWTDPAGNPVSSTKLVNDLDLYVDGASPSAAGTNTTFSSNRWLGNNFPRGSDFTSAILLSDAAGNPGTNIDEQVEALRDNVNNVENVFLSPPLADTYTIVVKGTRVNVNAVNSQSNSIVKDYALVIASAGQGTTNAAIAVTGPVITNNPNPFVIPMQRNGLTNGIALLNQRVGANSPLVGSTNGTTNQWSFYTFTNLTTFTNVAILTFLAPNVGFLQPNFADPGRPRFRDADIDLYVARNSVLANAGDITNLNPAVLSAADKSVGRGGTEILVYSNAAPGEVFFVGVKSEDQQSATFGLFAAASKDPFSQRDSSNNIVAHAIYAPVDIPDGSPDAPGGTNVFVLVIDDAVVQRLYLTNVITHERGGDLVGILGHTDTDGQDASVTLNNHADWNGTDIFIYDDSGQGDITNSTPTDGPGSLRSFTGHAAMGIWTFTVSDNALLHTGSVDALTLVIEPASTNQTNLVNITRTILPKSWIYAPANVPFDAISMEVCVSDLIPANPPQDLQLYIRRGQYPDQANFDYYTNVAPPGVCMTIGLGDNPALVPGDRYIVGVYNPNDIPVTMTLRVNVSKAALPGPFVKYEQTNTFEIPDDAVINSLTGMVTNSLANSYIFVTNSGRIADLRVGVRIDAERASDLVLHLVSPDGTRLLLAENRGGTNTLGYGSGSWQSNNLVLTTFTEDTNLTTVPIKFGTPPFTNSPNFFTPLVLDDGFENEPASLPSPAFGLPQGFRFSGWIVEQSDVDLIYFGSGLSYPAYDGKWAVDLNGNFPGAISTNVFLTPGQNYTISYAYSTENSAGPTAVVSLSGITNWQITATLPQWIVVTNAFTATVPVSKLQVTATSPGGQGVFVDHFRIEKNFTNSTPQPSYYLPEESLKPFFGSQAYGLWQLEVLDDRLGGSVTGKPTVLTWQLEIAFPNTNAPLVILTNHVDYTNILSGSNIAFFAVDVPCGVGFVTNTLTGLTPATAGVNLIFNNYFLPTNGFGDVVLLTNVVSTTSNVLVISSPPLATAPGRYYLAVTNANPQENNKYALRVDIKCGTGVESLTNGACFTEAIQPGAFHFFSFDVSNNPVQVTFKTTSASGDVDLYVRRGPIPPNLLQYDYASTVVGNGNETIVVTTNSSPIPMAAGPWQIGVTNTDSAQVTYCVRVDAIYGKDVPTVTTTTPTPGTNAPGSIQYYKVTFVSATQAIFAVSNIAPAMDLDMYIKKGLPLPSPTLYDISQSSTTVATVLLDTNTTPKLVAGDWYVAVVNTNTASATYNFFVDVKSPSGTTFLISPKSASYSGSNGFSFSWTAASSQKFQVQYATNFPSQWQDVGSPVQSSNGTFTFTDPAAATNQQRFYRLKQVP